MKRLFLLGSYMEYQRVKESEKKVKREAVAQVIFQALKRMREKK